MKRESSLKSAFMAQLHKDLPAYIAIRHEDVRTAGIPDLSITARNITSWWEFKHGTPKFKSSGIQELTMLRLAQAGFARYIIWLEDRDGSNKQTLIVQPSQLSTLQAERHCLGFNHAFLTDFIQGVHNEPSARAGQHDL